PARPAADPAEPDAPGGWRTGGAHDLRDDPYPGHDLAGPGVDAPPGDSGRSGSVCRLRAAAPGPDAESFLEASPDTDGAARQTLAHFWLVTEDADLSLARMELARAGVTVEQGPVMRSDRTRRLA